jgi:hypothetical protein
MSTARRTALTATLATTAALSIAGVSWGIGSTVGNEAIAPSPVAASANPAPLPSTTDSDVDTGAGHSATTAGRGYGRGGNGQGGGQGAGQGQGSGQGAGQGAGQGYGRGRAAGGTSSPGNGATSDRPGWRSSEAPGTGAGPGSGTGDHADLPPAVPGATVTDEVAAQLTYLIEEEKLAGDVYALGESLYGARVFTNIARAEDSHADEVRVLLDRYDLPDPTVGAAAGVFTDTDLQALYDTLAEQVRASWSDAVAAGILIEETDIADLQVLLDEGELPADVRAVAENLLAGSQRHLAAFQRQAG